MSRIKRMKQTSPPATRRISRGAGLGAFLALTAFYAPALQAQDLHAEAACEDVSGVWMVGLTLPGSGPTQVTLTLEQTECEVTGLVEGNNKTPFETGEVEGSTATFVVNATNQANGQGIAIAWEGTVEGDEISGTLEAPMLGTITFTGTRLEG